MSRIRAVFYSLYPRIPNVVIASVIGVVAWRLAVINGYVYCFYVLTMSISPESSYVIRLLRYYSFKKAHRNVDETPFVRHGLGDTRPVVILTAILESDLIVICTSFPIIYPWLSSTLSARGNQSSDRSRSQSRTLRAICTIGSAISWRSKRAFDRLSNPDTTGGTYALDTIHTTREYTVAEDALPGGRQPSNT